MERKKKKWYGSDMVFLAFIILLLAALIWFGFLVIQKAQSGKKLCQSVVSIEKMEYGEEFLKEAEKISGIRSVTPVLEVPVQLRAEDYTMEVTWLGTDLEVLEKKVLEAAEVSLSSEPVLLLGEKSLAGMTDNNGQVISEKKQKEFLSRFREMEWQYRLAGVEQETEDASSDWSPCRIAGILSFPAEEIYFPYDQAVNLMGISSSQSVKKILLTVQGEDNYKRALEYFMQK